MAHVPRNTSAGAWRTRDKLFYHTLWAGGACGRAANPGTSGRGAALETRIEGRAGSPSERGRLVADDSGGLGRETGDEAVVEARLALARASSGLNLDAVEAEAVRRQIARSLARARALRRVPLENGDEPDIVFVPFLGDDADARGLR